MYSIRSMSRAGSESGSGPRSLLPHPPPPSASSSSSSSLSYEGVDEYRATTTSLAGAHGLAGNRADEEGGPDALDTEPGL